MGFKSLTLPSSQNNSSNGGSHFSSLTLPDPKNNPANDQNEAPGGIGQKITNFFTGGLKQFARTTTQALNTPGEADTFSNLSQQHSDIQNNLQNAIRTKKAMGGDTTLLENALASHKADAPNLQDFTGNVVNKTTGQILGEAGGAALDVAGLGIGGGEAEKLATTATEDLVKKGAQAGAKSGSLFGGASGLTQSLQNKDSFGKTIGNVVLGSVVGGATGGLVGAGGAKIAKTIIGKGTSELEKDALDIITPKLTDSEKETAVAAGRGKTSGIFNTVKIEPTKVDKDAAKVVSTIVEKGKTATENINAVRAGIADEANKLKAIIGQNNHPYTFKELNSTLTGIDKPISIKSDAILSRQFDLVRNAFMDIAKKNGGDISSLLDSRKEFDALVDKEFPNLYDRENAPMRNAITSMRSAVNDFIETNLPNNVKFKDSLRRQSLMYHAVDNIATNAKGEIGTNILTRFAKNNPKTATALATGAGVLGVESAANKVKDFFMPKSSQ